MNDLQILQRLKNPTIGMSFLYLIGDSIDYLESKSRVNENIELLNFVLKEIAEDVCPDLRELYELILNEITTQNIDVYWSTYINLIEIDKQKNAVESDEEKIAWEKFWIEREKIKFPNQFNTYKIKGELNGTLHKKYVRHRDFYQSRWFRKTLKLALCIKINAFIKNNDSKFSEVFEKSLENFKIDAYQSFKHFDLHVKTHTTFMYLLNRFYLVKEGTNKFIHKAEKAEEIHNSSMCSEIVELHEESFKHTLDTHGSIIFDGEELKINKKIKNYLLNKIESIQNKSDEYTNIEINGIRYKLVKDE